MRERHVGLLLNFTHAIHRFVGKISPFHAVDRAGRFIEACNVGRRVVLKINDAFTCAEIQTDALLVERGVVSKTRLRPCLARGAERELRVESRSRMHARITHKARNVVVLHLRGEGRWKSARIKARDRAHA